MIPHFALKHHPHPLTKYESKEKKITIFRILVNWG